MAYRPQRVQKTQVLPISLIFRFLQSQARVQVCERAHRGPHPGFDEFMNIVMDDAEEVHLKSRGRKRIGRILLKGDTITLIQEALQ
uniref:Small nuclear ribonucleoprotein E n=1 Tax=Macrostomum lignano TaxID=282301 RepID=A0A1I8FI15_9PLAT